MSKPLLSVGTPVRLITDIPSSLLRAGDVVTVFRNFGFPTARISLHTCQYWKEPGEVHVYGIQFSTTGGSHRCILCDEEIEPVD